MEREEAIKVLNTYDVNFDEHTAEEIAEALGMAIEALKADVVSREECDKCKTDKEGVLLQQLAELQGDYETMKNAYEDALADAEWIPCNTQMPDELEAVNVTWVNHLAPQYYKHIEDVPFVDSAVYYRGKWYWWDATVIDILAEYGEDCNAEQIDKDIEVVAWMPLPKPYKGGDTK